MIPFLRGKLGYDKWRTPDGAWSQLATGTRDRRIATEYARMIERMEQRDSQDSDLILAVCAKPPRLRVEDLLSAFRAGAPSAIRARLNDEDLDPWGDRWLSSREAGLAPDTSAHYRVHIRHFIPAGTPFWLTAFTTPFVRSGLDGLDKLPGTKRK